MLGDGAQRGEGLSWIHCHSVDEAGPAEVGGSTGGTCATRNTELGVAYLMERYQLSDTPILNCSI